MSVDDKIIERVRKLLRLAADGTNPHVSAEALRKAQEYMAEHNIGQATLDQAEIKSEYVRSQFSVSRLKMHETMLMNSVSKAFGVDSIFGQRHSNDEDNWAQILFVGNESRVKLAAYSFEVLSRQMKKARAEFVAKLSSEMDEKVNERFGGYELLTDGQARQVKSVKRKKLAERADAFCLGWAFEIDKKVVAFAIGDAEKALIKIHIDNIEGVEEHAHDKPKITSDTFLGMEAARQANLHRPMEGSGAPTMNVGLLGETLKIGG